MKYFRVFLVLSCVWLAGTFFYYWLTHPPGSRFRILRPDPELKLPFDCHGRVTLGTFALSRCRCIFCGEPEDHLESCQLYGVAMFAVGETIARIGFRNLYWSRYHAAGFQCDHLVLPLWLMVIGFCLYPAAIVLRFLIRPRWRRLRHRCIHCSYNLTGNTSGVCPECGTPTVPRP